MLSCNVCVDLSIYLSISVLHISGSCEQSKDWYTFLKNLEEQGGISEVGQTLIKEAEINMQQDEERNETEKYDEFSNTY